MIISQEYISKLKAEIDILELIKEYTELKHMGGEIWGGKCPHPAHNDKEPSLRVWKKEQSWACMGCHNGKGEGSDVISFIQWIKNFNFVESIVYLAKKYNMPLPSDPHEERYKVNKMLAISYNTALKESIALSYLQERGFTSYTIDKWALGYDGAKITFPLIDRYGNVLGFTRRKLVELNEKKYNPKYKNSKTTEWFNKSQYLYGIRYFDKEHKYVKVTEGPTDVALSDQVGVKNIMCSLGTAFTDEHATLIKNLKKIPIFCFDGDEAGLIAMHKACKKMLALNIYPKVYILPPGKDMADMALQYKEQFEDIIVNESISYSYYKMKKMISSYHSDILEIRLKYMEQTKEILESCEEIEYDTIKDYIHFIMRGGE